jgi:GH18 family chitinase
LLSKRSRNKYKQAITDFSISESYLKFLTVLKQQLGTDHSVSIAAPASYWYLKAFPIDRIAAAIDYIVYMTYDLHGQWDAGNPNAYDQCASGRCIRSHVNLTETRNSLAISKS